MALNNFQFLLFLLDYIFYTLIIIENYLFSSLNIIVDYLSVLLAQKFYVFIYLLLQYFYNKIKKDPPLKLAIIDDNKPYSQKVEKEISMMVENVDSILVLNKNSEIDVHFNDLISLDVIIIDLKKK